MTMAIKVIDTALRDDFGFKHLLWVYNGRRGVHCWVCDGKARRLTNEQRAATADYFRVYKGNENSHKKVSLTGHALHPFLVRAYTYMQLLLWNLGLKNLASKNKALELRRCVEEIVFSLTYPRLDMEVSKHMNQLLKAPSCVHTKTGRICVPFDPNHCEQFDPTTVLTLSQVNF
ncbi:hypothetical protein K1719_011994 [Acacia pycnantha]|nr:hypothetical protein K1719_011994 [Acacia pycnantha]